MSCFTTVNSPVPMLSHQVDILNLKDVNLMLQPCHTQVTQVDTRLQKCTNLMLQRRHTQLRQVYTCLQKCTDLMLQHCYTWLTPCVNLILKCITLTIPMRPAPLAHLDTHLDERVSTTTEPDPIERQLDQARQIKLDIDSQNIVERRAALVKLKSDFPDLPVKDLAEILHVSRQTIYNDLHELNGEGNHATAE